jgi:hypothetical protein
MDGIGLGTTSSENIRLRLDEAVVAVALSGLILLSLLLLLF